MGGGAGALGGHYEYIDFTMRVQPLGMVIAVAVVVSKQFLLLSALIGTLFV